MDAISININRRERERERERERKMARWAEIKQMDAISIYIDNIWINISRREIEMDRFFLLTFARGEDELVGLCSLVCPEKS